MISKFKPNKYKPLKLNDLKKEGVTTLIAESNAGHYEGMLDKSFIIERGEIN